ncbi:hypothetical protein D9756_007078 [Leucocoprinus leucothites]|uniref:Uncharacterized protein n=1 Tax=Leucocoprinus leucothites TaxID=201217 RepID=A0A8H5FYT8_9AGAR|nr:hypothetical protein D9756_007078 [Leucoagaricus leucothites]
MSPQPTTRPKMSNSSSLVITIKYGGLKATQFFSKYTAKSYQQLLSDLTELGFPHPKRANIVFKSHGTLEFFWPIERNENSFFVKNLVKRVNLSQKGPFKDEQRAQRQQLSIASMNIREDIDYDPDLEQQGPAPVPPQAPKVTKRLIGQNQSQNQQSPPTKPSAKPAGERFHPYTRPSGSPITNQQSNGVIRQILQKPAKPASLNQRAAEVFLDEIGTSLRTPIRFKAEPVEPTIPPPPPVLPSAPSAQRRSSFATSGHSPSEVQIKREQIAPSFSFSVPPHAKTQSYIDLTCESTAPSFSSLSSFPSTSHASLVAGTPTISPEIPGMESQPAVSRIGIFDRSPSHNSLPFAAPRNGSSVIFEPPHTPVDVSATQSTPISIAVPKPNDLLSIQSLTKELFDLRNTITTALDRQNIIVEELRRLNAAYVPSKLSLTSSSEAKADAATRARLDELAKEIESHKTKQAELTRELEAERNKRLEMESVLADIRREQKSPFVVPALLDTFVKISQASTAALKYKSTFGSNQ